MFTKKQLAVATVSQAVSALLKFQLHKSLRLNSQTVAFLRHGKLSVAPLVDEKVEMGKAVGFDATAWAAVMGDVEQRPEIADAMVAAINSPFLIELSPVNLHDFNVDEVRFTFEDIDIDDPSNSDCMDIQDPTTSECGRFDVSPSYYGFDQLWEGAWSKALDDGTRIQVEGRVMSRFDCLGEVIAKVHLDNVVFDAEK